MRKLSPAPNFKQTNTQTFFIFFLHLSQITDSDSDDKKGQGKISCVNTVIDFNVQKKGSKWFDGPPFKKIFL